MWPQKFNICFWTFFQKMVCEGSFSLLLTCKFFGRLLMKTIFQVTADNNNEQPKMQIPVAILSPKWLMHDVWTIL